MSLNSDPPPPYSQMSQEASHQRSARILRDLGAVAPPPQMTFDLTARLEAEKLRYFLLYLLIIDYDINANIALDAQARTHFISLAGNLADFRDYSTTASSEDRNTLIAYFETYIYRPADILDIPARIIIHRLFWYRRSLDPWGSYQPSVQRILRRRGPEELADKFMTDTDILITRLVPPTDPLRRAMLDRVHYVRSLYFHTMIGTYDRVSHGREAQQRLATASMALTRVGGIHTGRTAYLERYLEAQTQGVSSIEELCLDHCDLHYMVTRCLDRLKTKAVSSVLPRDSRDRGWHGQRAFLDLDYLAPPR